MHFTLQNEHVLVTVASWGAELISLKGRRTKVEYIWQADSTVWGRHAPILFPIVGRLTEDRLKVDGKTYEMKQHGFARDSEFRCIEQYPEHLTLQLTANETTRSRYPYEFALTVSYEIVGTRLKVNYQVKNRQDTPIYFSIGAHPGFTCPLIPQSQFEDYALQFEKPETLDRLFLSGGLRTGKTAPLLAQSRHLPLSHNLFEADALIFDGAQSQYISLVHHQRGPVITLHCPNYPYLGVWTKPNPNAQFICIEPWYGIADREGTTLDISQKEGIIVLPANDRFSCDYTIEIHPEAIG